MPWKSILKKKTKEGDPQPGPSGVPVNTLVEPSQPECPTGLATTDVLSVEAVTMSMTDDPEVAVNTLRKHLSRGKQPRSFNSIRNSCQ